MEKVILHLFLTNLIAKSIFVIFLPISQLGVLIFHLLYLSALQAMNVLRIFALFVMNRKNINDRKIINSVLLYLLL